MLVRFLLSSPKGYPLQRYSIYTVMDSGNVYENQKPELKQLVYPGEGDDEGSPIIESRWMSGGVRSISIMRS